MSRMNLRSKSVLEASIKEYIRSGKPVSSRLLERVYDFGAKEATIRNELNLLTQEGFLAQLHTSGGRVPTDKGYQFFIANTIDNAADSKKIINEHHYQLADNLKKGRLRDFVEDFSGETKSLGVGQKSKETEVYKSGLNELVGHLDLGTKQEIYEIIKDFELLDQRLKEMRNKFLGSFSAPKVFIGKKSPITKSENLSVILDSFDIDDEKVVIAVIGPKRMDYDKNLKLFKGIRSQLEK